VFEQQARDNNYGDQDTRRDYERHDRADETDAEVDYLGDGQVW